ncbi:hypothetical protein QCA50_004420 [Cerrena zonata]|uniref:Carboxylic ester hydrolase n=1 Tax=Cerrena zonata TaxID=2478898 RepID=A0AAW0GS69_9APHY
MSKHLQDELLASSDRVTTNTNYGIVTGGRAENGAKVFLEIPYALPPIRFQDPQPLPSSYRYEAKEYIYESSYCAQPTNDGQAAGTSLEVICCKRVKPKYGICKGVPVEDKLGRGKPTENPLFLNIVTPPTTSSDSRFPVKVYIHGGFLQFGSPHGLSSQAQYVSVERSEVWVNIGYRLSVFGFLACDEPQVSGNFGFKDQWLALLWIKKNIAAFGGDPDNIQITGLSAGAHSVHQLLHHASRLQDGVSAPFHSAILQSNAIVYVHPSLNITKSLVMTYLLHSISPKTPTELRSQFQAFCRALNLDPTSSDVLSKLRNPDEVPWSTMTSAIDTDAFGTQYGTFRGCLEGDWLKSDPMEWQRSGGFSRALKAKGVRSIIVGDLTEEWYLYSIAHPVSKMGDIELNLERYYQDDMIKKIMALYKTLPAGAPEPEVKRLMGDILSDGQVHIPVRILGRDLINTGFPVLRYEIQWTPEQNRPFGYVTHATDRALWALRIPALQADQVSVALAWLDTIASEVKKVEQGNQRSYQDILALKTDRSIGWIVDEQWDRKMELAGVLPGEANGDT